MSRIPKNNLEYSRHRLNRIMSRRRLSFNPYTASDERLIEISRSSGWGNLWDITEIVTIRFTRLREVADYREFDGIYMTVAKAEDEIFIPLAALTIPITANDSLRQERTKVGNRPVRNAEDVKKLVGHSYFVSRIIRGVNIFGSGKSAYQLHKLKGDIKKDAKIIREAMCEAKIEMLKRLLTYPEAPNTLSCTRGFFDYETRIRQAIELIHRFPEIEEKRDN